MAKTTELKWSIGWLEGFKSHNNIYKRKQHSKAASVNIEGAEDHIIELQAIIAPYPPEDVYNINKTGLF